MSNVLHPFDSPPDYSKHISAFRETLGQLIDLHGRTRNLPMQGIAPRAGLMFARLTFIAGSISRLCPNPDDDNALWDFTSVAILARALFESVLFFRYFVAPAPPEEWVARFAVLDLHDRCERARLLEALNQPEHVASFDVEANELRDILKKDAYFNTLEPSRQKKILNGYSASVLSLNEMQAKYGGDGDWPVYHLLSHYTHGYSMSYLRNDEERRDGLPNDVDRVYLPLLLQWLTPALNNALHAYQNLPAGITDEIGLEND